MNIPGSWQFVKPSLALPLIVLAFKLSTGNVQQEQKCSYIGTHGVIGLIIR